MIVFRSLISIPSLDSSHDREESGQEAVSGDVEVWIVFSSDMSDDTGSSQIWTAESGDSGL